MTTDDYADRILAKTINPIEIPVYEREPVQAELIYRRFPDLRPKEDPCQKSATTVPSVTV